MALLRLFHQRLPGFSSIAGVSVPLSFSVECSYRRRERGEIHGELRSGAQGPFGNRANTLALLGCLRETLEERPFREAEEALAGSRAMALTTQTPHALYAMLLKCGAVEAIEVPEELGGDANGSLSDGCQDSRGRGRADGGEDVDALDPLDDPCSDLPDQPVDYLLRTTEIGRAALDEFEPAKRFSELLAAEPTATAMPTTACWPYARRELPKPT